MSLPFRPANKELPRGVSLPIPPPEGFNPLEASNEDLVKYGLPPRPAMDEFPDEFVWWEKICSSAGSFVMPAFEPLPARRADKKTGDHISSNWSGAVISASKDHHFTDVWASWTVSRPHPDNWAWRERYWESGSFAAGTWTGIDGHKENGKGSSDVLQAGIGHRCIVSTHQDTEYPIHPWWEWYPEHPWAITGFQIATGDLVSVTISAKSPTSASILFNNFSACTYTSFNVTAPEDVKLQGSCAEWIVEAHHESAGKSTMSYLGSSFFFNCGATEKASSGVTGTSKGHSIYRNLRGATFLEIKQDNQVLSTASSALSNDTVLGVIAERRVHECCNPRT